MNSSHNPKQMLQVPSDDDYQSQWCKQELDRLQYAYNPNPQPQPFEEEKPKVSFKAQDRDPTVLLRGPTQAPRLSAIGKAKLRKSMAIPK